MNGQSLQKAFVPLPGGGTAVYNSGGLAYYRHPDWLGSSRLATTPSRTVYAYTGYAPFGENYEGQGSTDLSFTGQNQDTVSGLDDFLYREYSPAQGRWIKPDPSGLQAVDTTNPQSWNRYGYVNNSPLATVDSKGLAAGQQTVDYMGMSCTLDGVDQQCSPLMFGEDGPAAQCPYNVCDGYWSKTLADGSTNIILAQYQEDAIGDGSYYVDLSTVLPAPQVSTGAAGSNLRCESNILSAVNNEFGSNDTSANVGTGANAPFSYSKGAPQGQGTLNLNISSNQPGSASPGYYPVNWWTYIIGYGPTLHVQTGPGGNGGLDSDKVLPFSPNLFTAHIDSAYPKNPIGGLFHILLNMTPLGGYPGC